MRWKLLPNYLEKWGDESRPGPIRNQTPIPSFDSIRRYWSERIFKVNIRQKDASAMTRKIKSSYFLFIFSFSIVATAVNTQERHKPDWYHDVFNKRGEIVCFSLVSESSNQKNRTSPFKDFRMIVVQSILSAKRYGDWPAGWFNVIASYRNEENISASWFSANCEAEAADSPPSEPYICKTNCYAGSARVFKIRLLENSTLSVTFGNQKTPFCAEDATISRKVPNSFILRRVTTALCSLPSVIK